MTPTLFGRWQTRLFLLATVGIAITLPFVLLNQVGVYFLILGYVALFGIGWDLIYIYLQKRRWDRDWIGIFQLFAGVWEALFLFTLIKGVGLPGINSNLSLSSFAIHYSCVWLGIFTASQTLMRILFPRWRFWGGAIF